MDWMIFSGNQYGCSRSRKRQMGRQLRDSTDLNNHMLSLQRSESRRIDADRVRCRGQLGNSIVAGFIRYDDKLQVGTSVPHRDLGIRYDSATLVINGAADSAVGGRLRICVRNIWVAKQKQANARK